MPIRFSLEQDDVPAGTIKEFSQKFDEDFVGLSVHRWRAKFDLQGPFDGADDFSFRGFRLGMNPEADASGNGFDQGINRQRGEKCRSYARESRRYRGWAGRLAACSVRLVPAGSGELESEHEGLLQTACARA